MSDFSLPGKYGELYEKVQKQLARFENQKNDPKLPDDVLFEDGKYMKKLSENIVSSQIGDFTAEELEKIAMHMKYEA